MNNFLQYVSLKTVVSYFLDQYQKSIRDFDRCWILAFRALALIGQQFAYLPKSMRIPVDANMTVPFPPDLISWTKIGVMDENGMLSSLKINNGLSLFRDNNPNRLNDLTGDVNTSIGTLVSSPFFFNFYGNGVYYNTPLFGYGGGLQQFGECRVDEKNRVIILPPDFKFPAIMIEYLSAPEKDDDYVIETYYQEAIIAFIAWKLKLAPREEFYGACVEARRASPTNRVTLQNINQVIRETGGQYLKG